VLLNLTLPSAEGATSSSHDRQIVDRSGTGVAPVNHAQDARATIPRSEGPAPRNGTSGLFVLWVTLTPTLTWLLNDGPSDLDLVTDRPVCELHIPPRLDSLRYIG
jgi:hypothetical protein